MMTLQSWLSRKSSAKSRHNSNKQEAEEQRQEETAAEIAPMPVYNPPSNSDERKSNYSPYSTVQIQLTPVGVGVKIASDDTEPEEKEDEQRVEQSSEQCPIYSCPKPKVAVRPSVCPIYSKPSTARKPRPTALIDIDFQVPSIAERSCSLARGTQLIPASQRSDTPSYSHPRPATAASIRDQTSTTLPRNVQPISRPAPPPKPVAVKPTERGIIVDKNMPQPYSVVLLPPKGTPIQQTAATPADTEQRERLNSQDAPVPRALLYNQLVTFTESQPASPDGPVYAQIPELDDKSTEKQREISPSRSHNALALTDQSLRPDSARNSPLCNIKTRTTRRSTAKRRQIRQEVTQEEYVSMDSLSLQATPEDRSPSKESPQSCPATPHYSIPSNLPFTRRYGSVQDLLSTSGKQNVSVCSPTPIQREAYEMIAISADSGVSDWSNATTPDKDTVEEFSCEENSNLQQPTLMSRSNSIKSLPASSRGLIIEQAKPLMVNRKTSAPPRQTLIIGKTDRQMSYDVPCGLPLRRALAKECLLASTIRVAGNEKSTIL